MARELTPHELRELLGAYALDAVDGDERAQLEAWLERTPDALDELATLRETAALLSLTGEAAPPEVWARIEATLAEDPPALVLPLRRRRVAFRVVAGLAAASAAAAVITAIVLSDKMARQDDRLEAVAHSMERDGMRRAAIAAMADPRARTLYLESVEGHTATLVTTPAGDGFLMSAELPRLPNGRAYQLWAMTGTEDAPAVVSAGVLGRDVELAAFRAPTDAWGFAITEEAAAGAMQPSGPHVLEGSFA